MFIMVKKRFEEKQFYLIPAALISIDEKRCYIVQDV